MTESTTAVAAVVVADHNITSLKPSVANTKFPRGVYPQRESDLSLTVSSGKDGSQQDHMQPYRLKLGVITSSGTKLYPTYAAASHDDDKLEESTAVVQLHPVASGDNAEDHNIKETAKIPDEFDWLLKKGVTGAEINTAATVIQK